MPSQTRKTYLKNRITSEFRSAFAKEMDRNEYELHILAGETQLETLQVRIAVYACRSTTPTALHLIMAPETNALIPTFY
jgi:hypothetical protein